jgi:glycine cleavage system H lipoate-binding protein
VVLSRSISPEQRIIFTLGMTQAQFERLGVQFVDCVPLNARLQGGIQPSTFAYVEGSNGSAQLKVPAPVEGEVIAVNAMVISQPGSAVMPPGFLVQVDAGEADEEASREFEEWTKDHRML